MTLNKANDELIERAKSSANSSDPLIHLLWKIDGLDIWHRTGGKRGHSLEDCKRYALASVSEAINHRLTQFAEEVSNRLLDAEDYEASAAVTATLKEYVRGVEK